MAPGQDCFSFVNLGRTSKALSLSSFLTPNDRSRLFVPPPSDFYFFAMRCCGHAQGRTLLYLLSRTHNRKEKIQFSNLPSSFENACRPHSLLGKKGHERAILLFFSFSFLEMDEGRTGETAGHHAKMENWRNNQKNRNILIYINCNNFLH